METPVDTEGHPTTDLEAENHRNMIVQHRRLQSRCQQDSARPHSLFLGTPGAPELLQPPPLLSARLSTWPQVCFFRVRPGSNLPGDSDLRL